MLTEAVHIPENLVPLTFVVFFFGGGGGGEGIEGRGYVVKI